MDEIVERVARVLCGRNCDAPKCSCQPDLRSKDLCWDGSRRTARAVIEAIHGPTTGAAAKRLHVAQQHRAVAHLATQIAMLSFDCAEIVLSGHSDAILDIQGNTSVRWMEVLGDMLNNVDAADEETIRWMTPIYERARQMFPPKASSGPQSHEG